jgi:drug/metabolite transporter (DMT)-like permease
VLAIGAYLSGVLGLIRSLALGMMAALMIGVLKGTSTTSIVAGSGLCVALIPLGFTVLREPPAPRWQDYLLWFGLLAILLPVMFFLGQKG